MKKIVSCLFIIVVGSLVFAASYTNNTYQKLADQYSRQAQAAFNAAQYERAIELSRLAEENAALSKAYIDRMTVRQNAEKELLRASTRIKWAKSIDGDKNFPIALSAAEAAYANAEAAFQREDYEATLRYARESLAALDGIRQLNPLPEYYVVRPWAETRDCYWNISGRPYVYNNPLLWENLYQANKSKMPQPNNPDLILPGMKMRIPSITGEYRDGVYSPNRVYDPYSANR